MEDYKSMCKQIQNKVKQITEGRGFFARYELTIDEPISGGAHEITTVNLSVDFFDDVFKVAEKLRELLNEKETKKTEHSFGIKGKRDEALMNLYKHYNRMTALDKIGYAESEMMRDLIVDIEKLEHARHMEASDEIAKMSIEKLEKFARPMPGIKMDVKQFEEIAKDHYGKEGAKNDD